MCVLQLSAKTSNHEPKASAVTQTEVSCGSIVMQPSAEAGSQTKRAAAKQRTDLCPEDKA